MKIPLDFFLRLSEKMFDEFGFSDVSKKIKKHFENEDDDFKDILSDLNLQKIIKAYISSDDALAKKIKKKVKKLEKMQREEEENEEEEEEEKPKKNLKKKTKRKETEESSEEEEEKTKKKKKKKEESEDEEEEEEEKTKKKKKKKEESEDEEDEPPKKQKRKKTEESIDLENMTFLPRPKGNKNEEGKRFQRIDNSLAKSLPINLKDNSYEHFMNSTGDKYGQVANEKLKFTRGKDFKKEKTKFKNKSSASGFQILQTVRSIPLEDESD